VTPDAFEGQWRLERQIDDRRAGHTAQFSGVARIVRDAEGWAYAERGRLCLPGQAAIQAERRYQWRPRSDTVIAVHFDDGRFFHDMPLAGGTAAHWCDPDQYDVTYDFTGWPLWSSLWVVRGPRKAYQMMSRYARAEAV
jgi:hypothetical protein